jgi:predicted TIM-barrel fold metal-dependent hydrolase
MSADGAIDADGHVEPPLDLDWGRYIARPWAERVRLHAEAMHARYGAITARRVGMWDPHERLTDMEREGIATAVLFGGLLGIDPVDVPESAACAVASARGYNDWLAEYCAAQPERLKGVACLPLRDIEAACRELERAVTQLGFVSGVLPVRVGEHRLDSPYFAPLFELAEALDVALSIHAPGFYGDAYELRWPTHFRRHAYGFVAGLLAGSMDVLCGGVLARHPTLRLALLEGGCGWLPFWIERLDEHYEQLPGEAPEINRPPSHFLRTGRLFVSCEPGEKTLPAVLAALGDDFVVYASDYAHYDCLFPDSVRVLSERDEISAASRRKILRDNPARLFGRRLTFFRL